jgi:hypothetical protein
MKNKKHLEVVIGLLKKDSFKIVNVLNFIEINEITNVEKQAIQF